MQAIILAAGYATRLYPLTKDKPKALLPLDGKPILDYILDELKEIKEVDRVIVVSNSAFYKNFTEWAKNKNVVIIDDGTKSAETRLGAVGDIRFAIKNQNINEDLIVIAGDNYFTFKLKDYYAKFKEIYKDFVCYKRIGPEEDIRRYAVAVLDENGRVTGLEEKPKNPKSDIAVFATYLYRKDTLPLFDSYIESGGNPDAPGYFIEWLHKIRDVYAFEMNGDCYDIGTKESYEEVNAMVKKLNAV
jgi:glucose-1-phosphate thymidylyltransferase